MRIQRLAFFLLLLLSAGNPTSAQEVPEYKKNAFQFNLGNYGVNEINFGFEHFFSARRSLEINGGLVYRNDFLVDMAKDWTNSLYFYERGFTVRAQYKLFKKKPEDSKWRDYISPMIYFKYLYYGKTWFANELKNEKTGDPYDEYIYQTRFRDRFGFQFHFGKIYEMNQTFALEFYYGVGLRGTLVNRIDVAKQDSANAPVYQVNWQDDRFYVRPSIHGGVKLRVSF